MYVNVLKFIYSYYVDVSRRGMQSFANRDYWLEYELKESILKRLDLFNVFDENVQAIFILYFDYVRVRRAPFSSSDTATEAKCEERLHGVGSGRVGARLLACGGAGGGGGAWCACRGRSPSTGAARAPLSPRTRTSRTRPTPMREYSPLTTHRPSPIVSSVRMRLFVPLSD